MTSTHNTMDALDIWSQSTQEARRLARLGKLLQPSTKRLFEQAGITTGMKVLDAGCGAGDVTLLLAEPVGPTGSIVGVDVHAEMLETARTRVKAAGLANVSFLVGDVCGLAPNVSFDAVVGRNILLYVSDPTAVLRAAALHLRSGGIVAFQELDCSISESISQLAAVPPRLRQAGAWVFGGFRQAGVQMQLGFQFPRLFLEAGLPSPELTLEGIVGTRADWIGYDFLTDVLGDILPKLHEYGVLKEALDAERYVGEVRTEVTQQQSFVPLFFMAGAWAHKG